MKVKHKSSIPEVLGVNRSDSADRAVFKHFSKLLDDGNSFPNTKDLAYERKTYLTHLDKIRRAHEIELKNVRMTLINIADEVVTK